MSQLVRERIVEFLREIGIEVKECPLPEDTFLPGIAIQQGVICYDAKKLLYPGDLLHEAGHLAVVPSVERRTLGDDVGGDGGIEMAAIAWSYAACMFLGLPAEVVFHPHGYKGGSASLRENFANGHYLGVPLLEWRGLTDYQRPGTSQSVTRYPAMKKWLSD